MFEININIRWFISRSRNKSFEKQIKFLRIYRSNAQTKANGRICSGAPALAKNFSCSCLSYDVIYGEEVRSVIHFLDELQFMIDVADNFLRQWFAENFLRALP